MKTGTNHVVAQGRISTPMGVMTVAATELGLAGLWFDHQTHHPGAIDAAVDDEHVHVRAARRWLDSYWRGEVPTSVALDPRGTPFQQAVWRALLAIEPGHTSTYGEIAAAIDRPAASRAVGAAIGRNPVGIIVPCHRVIGRDGTLTGYAGGLDRKQRLLAHEGATAVGANALPLFSAPGDADSRHTLQSSHPSRPPLSSQSPSSRSSPSSPSAAPARARAKAARA